MESRDLKKAGLKATLPRIKILEMLEHSVTRHMSAEDIYKALLDSGEDVGLATVYRVLTQFESAGLANGVAHRLDDFLIRAGDFDILEILSVGFSGDGHAIAMQETRFKE